MASKLVLTELLSLDKISKVVVSNGVLEILVSHYKSRNEFGAAALWAHVFSTRALN